MNERKYIRLVDFKTTFQEYHTNNRSDLKVTTTLFNVYSFYLFMFFYVFIYLNLLMLNKKFIYLFFVRGWVG